MSSVSERRLLPWMAFCAGYLMVFFLGTATPLTVPWYFPLEHRWALTVSPSSLAMDFYGRVLWAVGGGALAALAAGAGLAARPRGIGSPGWSWRLAVWSAVLVLFGAGLVVSILIHRHPIPLASPAGAVER